MTAVGDPIREDNTDCRVERPAPTTNWLYAVTYGNGQFAAVGGHIHDIFGGGSLDRGSIITSADGVNWVLRVPEVMPGLRRIAYGGGQFVATGDGGILLTSTDGINWVQREPLGIWGYGPNAIAYGDGHFLAVGNRQGILDSGSIISLLITRKDVTGSRSLSLEGPTGLDYTIQTSIDLISWRDVTKITSSTSTTVILDALAATSANAFYRVHSP